MELKETFQKGGVTGVQTCALPIYWHSAKTAALPSAAWKTLGKDICFAECHQGHSAKPPSPSPRRRNGRFSLPSALWHSAKRFTECPRKSTRQRRLCR